MNSADLPVDDDTVVEAPVPRNAVLQVTTICQFLRLPASHSITHTLWPLQVRQRAASYSQGQIPIADKFARECDHRRCMGHQENALVLPTKSLLHRRNQCPHQLTGAVVDFWYVLALAGGVVD